jgi:hypothetical protein
MQVWQLPAIYPTLIPTSACIMPVPRFYASARVLCIICCRALVPKPVMHCTAPLCMLPTTAPACPQVTSKVIAKEARLNIIPGWVGTIEDDRQALQVGWSDAAQGLQLQSQGPSVAHCSGQLRSGLSGGAALASVPACTTHHRQCGPRVFRVRRACVCHGGAAECIHLAEFVVDDLHKAVQPQRRRNL